MTKIEYSVFAPYTAKSLFDMIKDIESYPLFVPWCVASRILEKRDNFIIADLAVRYYFLSTSYTSEVELHENHEIRVNLIKGPFKYLYNYWRFKESQNGTNIEFMIDFEPKTAFLENLINDQIDKYSSNLMKSFLDRAAKILKKIQ